jgi:hypothetical protein
MPLIVKKEDTTADISYAFRLRPTGQLEFELVSYDSIANTRTSSIAVSDPDPKKCLIAPNTIIEGDL